MFHLFRCFAAAAAGVTRVTMVLNPVISKLSGKLVVLASASPRRLEILRNAVCCHQDTLIGAVHTLNTSFTDVEGVGKLGILVEVPILGFLVPWRKM